MTSGEPSCPATFAIGDGAEDIDLMCWLPLGHGGAHRDVRGSDGDELCWQSYAEATATYDGT